jgi:hypothetical protein
VKTRKVKTIPVGRRKRPAPSPLERPAAGRDQGRQPAQLSWERHSERPIAREHDSFVERMTPAALQAAFLDLAHRPTTVANPDPAEHSDAQWAVTRRWILERRAAIGRALLKISPQLPNPEIRIPSDLRPCEERRLRRINKLLNLNL